MFRASPLSTRKLLLAAILNPHVATHYFRTKERHRSCLRSVSVLGPTMYAMQRLNSSDMQHTCRCAPKLRIFCRADGPHP